MRRQRHGYVVSVSSGASLRGAKFVSAYATSKFGLEGWMESLAPEVAPYGIATTIVEPGYFRTELRGPKSTTYAEPTIKDYAERTAAQLKWWAEQDERAGGEPARLADLLLLLAGLEQPPRRFMAGADAIAMAEHKVAELREQIKASRDLSVAFAYGSARSS